MKRALSTILGLAALTALPSAPAEAGDTPFIGEIMMVGYTFCPRGWANADGQLLPITQNSALFSLYGTTYGGDGRTTFALPDLRGRVALHTGQGPGLSNHPMGAKGGQETVTQTVTEMPAHSHAVTGTVMASAGAGNSPTPTNNFNALNPAAANYGPVTAGTNPVAMAAGSIAATAANTGGGQAMPNMQPFLTMRYCVALQGIFPSRS